MQQTSSHQPSKQENQSWCDLFDVIETDDIGVLPYDARGVLVNDDDDVRSTTIEATADRLREEHGLRFSDYTITRAEVSIQNEYSKTDFTCRLHLLKAQAEAIRNGNNAPLTFPMKTIDRMILAVEKSAAGLFENAHGLLKSTTRSETQAETLKREIEQSQS